jgi:hypothetical protein
MKNNFLKIKNIILMCFKMKTIFKSNQYHTSKPTIGSGSSHNLLIFLKKKLLIFKLF